MDEVLTISPEELSVRQGQGPIHLIDVRRPDEYAQFHVAGSRNISWDQFTAEQLPSDGAPVYLICRRGSQSEEVYERLRANGVTTPLFVVAGGILAWYEAELPLEYPHLKKRRITPHRVVVGLLFASSVLLALFVHRGFLGLAGYTAAYLVAIGVAEFGLWNGMYARPRPR